MSTTCTERPLELPITGQALRQAVEARDMRCLSGLATQLRVAGYRLEPQRLVSDLLDHGCTPLTDSFGHRLLLQVRVPDRPLRPVDDSIAFRLAA